MSDQDAALSSAKAAIVTVGGEDPDSRGRGFIVETRLFRLVITAAHCLPYLPAAHPASHIGERTYRPIIGPLGGQPTVSAECYFVDPIADLAVLGSPDDQALCAEANAYESFVDGGDALAVGAVTQPSKGWLLALNGQWETCTADTGGWGGRSLTVQGAKPEAIAGGTSGSPIIVDGRAVGVMSCGEDLNPVLMNDLPGWLLAELEQAATRELKTTWSKNELSAALRLAKEEDLS